MHASLHDLLDMVRGIRVYGSTLYNYNYRDNNNNYRTCIMYIQLLRPFSFDHYASSTWYIMTCTVHPGLVSCNFYACTIHGHRIIHGTKLVHTLDKTNHERDKNSINCMA